GDNFRAEHWDYIERESTAPSAVLPAVRRVFSDRCCTLTDSAAGVAFLTARAEECARAAHNRVILPANRRAWRPGTPGSCPPADHDGADWRNAVALQDVVCFVTVGIGGEIRDRVQARPGSRGHANRNRLDDVRASGRLPVDRHNISVAEHRDPSAPHAHPLSN